MISASSFSLALKIAQERKSCHRLALANVLNAHAFSSASFCWAVASEFVGSSAN